MSARPCGGQLPKFLTEKLGTEKVRDLIAPDGKITRHALMKRERRIASEGSP